ncbi:CAMK family protein kinase [Histomonas meleagridis]|uniref:CAMK family protein kinase n=1 Tax=Histomonas meleagridis TaxID=135588 RepID=UPI003559813F|nr:CAMK family protein kinase [Histomonas meleagridis]KAH0796909.1 CAMK family protein kinase [Histomonas meleagridis]
MSFYPLPLKPSNIFVLPNLTILFTDIYELSSDISWALQTPDPSQLAFVAPEYFLKTCQPSTFSDVWSLGMILCYICIHSLPFSTKNIFTMIKTITSNSFKIPCDLPPDIKYILSSIFILTPNQRPPVAFLRDPMVLKAHAGKHRRSSEPLNSKPMIECSSTNSIRLSARQVIDPHQRFFPRQTKINSANPRKYPFQQTSSFSVRCRFAAPTASKDSIETPI